MRPEFSNGTSSPDGMVALALVTALISEMIPEQQRQLLSRARALIPAESAGNSKEARRMIETMLRQVQPTT